MCLDFAPLATIFSIGRDRESGRSLILAGDSYEGESKTAAHPSLGPVGAASEEIPGSTIRKCHNCRDSVEQNQRNSPSGAYGHFGCSATDIVDDDATQ